MGGAERTGPGVVFSGGGGKDDGEENAGNGLLKAAGTEVLTGGECTPVTGRADAYVKGTDDLGGATEEGTGVEKLGCAKDGSGENAGAARGLDKTGGIGVAMAVVAAATDVPAVLGGGVLGGVVSIPLSSIIFCKRGPKQVQPVKSI